MDHHIPHQDLEESSPLLGGSVSPSSSPLRRMTMRQSESFGPPESNPLYQQSHQHHRRYEVSGAMNRLRSSMVGGTSIFDQNPKNSTSSVDGGDKTPSIKKSARAGFSSAMSQVPAIALIAMFHLMIGIPFGVSYFPLYWSSSVNDGGTGDDEDSEGLGGPFPLPGKEALGIRMFLFSTIVGQLVFTAMSQFNNPIGLQMVENVPFCHELSAIVLKHQGHGIDALSTLFVMFGLASAVVGVVFYVLGKARLGRIVYFFPAHTLIGCIGGIGVLIAKTGVEVTINDTFSLENTTEKFYLLRVVLVFEVVLRILEMMTKDESGKPKYTLLSPIFFCAMTPIFYFMLFAFGVSLSEAEDAGYFFPPLNQNESEASKNGVMASIFLDENLWDMWTVVNFPSVSWLAIWDSLPTLLALTLFSLIHVPINIPAFALSTGTEADMNNELMAHGYSNMIAGLFGGLQNYMAYTQSVLYHKSGGRGQASGVAVALTTSVLFFVGPTIASYIPRCMAGTLLLHVGLDLFLEGVWDSYGSFDPLEYAGVWLIVVVMTLYGMEAAMIAGVIAAVSTYAVQSITYLSPIRGSMPATTLRSSVRTRDHKAQDILNSSSAGRSRILVVQLQGHLFFGNMAHFTTKMNELVGVNPGENRLRPVVMIVDCSLVLSIDSSAAQAIVKLKDTLLKKYQVELCVFVTGSDDGFPTEFALSKQLSTREKPFRAPQTSLEQIEEDTTLLIQTVFSEEDSKRAEEYRGSRVFDSLDSALIFAEDCLIARQDASLLVDVDSSSLCNRLLSQEIQNGSIRQISVLEEERELGPLYLERLCPIEMKDGDADHLFSLFKREVYKSGDFVWKQHAPSTSLKLLLTGMLIAELENEAGTTETISKGNLIGETGLVNDIPRMSSVRCLSEEAVVYSLSRESFILLIEESPRVARYIDLITIAYLTHRVQHVSNRIFETRCLPI